MSKSSSESPPATAAGTESFNEELWFTIFGQGHPALIEKQQTFRTQGSAPRCKLCLAPFGAGEAALDESIPGPSNRNPRYCSLCDTFVRQNPGGAKLRLSMVFTDVRGSARLSEELELREYVRLINEFYRTTTTAFIETDGFMMDVIGDEVFAVYPTGFSGVGEASDEAIVEREARAARKALSAVRKLSLLGRGNPPEALPFGISLHTAEVYVGTVRGAEEGIFDVRVWGPEVNRAARLCSKARPGEALVTAEAARVSGLSEEGLLRRSLELKGFSTPSEVTVLGHSASIQPG